MSASLAGRFFTTSTTIYMLWLYVNIYTFSVTLYLYHFWNTDTNLGYNLEADDYFLTLLSANDDTCQDLPSSHVKIAILQSLWWKPVTGSYKVNRIKKVKLLSHVQLFVTPWTVSYHALCLWDFPSKSTGVGCHFLLQRIFPTQGLNLGLPHCRQMLYHLRHQGSQ